MLRRLAPLLVVAAAMFAPAGANAAVPLTHCGQTPGLQCGTVDVPLDRSGGTVGTIALHVETLPPATRDDRGVMFLIAGGPGQGSARTFDLGDPDNADYWQEIFPGYRLVAVDNRGTGRSGLISCPALQTTVGATAEQYASLARDCAVAIGSRRVFYSTSDHAEDLESVRLALGYGRIALYGVSYGTKLALAYALAHPASVDRIVLDSVVPTDLPDPFDGNTLREMPGTLRAFCAKVCAGATRDFGADVAAVGNRLEASPISGKIITPGGTTKVVRMNGEDLLSLVVDADLNAGLASELPAAVHAAVGGYARPLLRLVDLDRRTSVFPADDLSWGLNAATICADGEFPWAPDTPPAARRAVIDATLAAMPASAFGPFGKWAARNGIAYFCEQWPAPAGRAPLGRGPLPNVPVLVLSGGFDLRTPTADARAVAALFPKSHLLVVPGVGHAVLYADYSLCSQHATRDWILGKTGIPSVCARVPPLVNVVGAYPRRPARAATLALVGKTVREAAASWLSSAFSGGPGTMRGLYGGTLSNDGFAFALKRYSLVPGIAVTGTLVAATRDLPFGIAGTVRVSGSSALTGKLKVTGSRISGTLAGHRVAGRF